MLDPDLIELFVRPLDQLRIRYLISGSVAAMIYGEPRFTNDIDLVVFLRAAEVERMRAAYPAPDFYLPPANFIATEIDREHGQFNIIHADSGLKADCFVVGHDAFHAWAFRHARQYPFDALNVTLAPPEYVIVRKLEYFREGGSDKHLRDIRAMLAVSGELIGREPLMEWIQRQGVEEQWKRVDQMLNS
jgi:hypothetical protein